jgi:D-galactonate transporter
MTTLAAEPLHRPAPPDSAADAVYRKVAWRLIPLLFLCYIAAYLDRVNVGFAKLQMQQALQFSDSVYGFGAGIFFIGYFIFEIPSNVLLHKVGAGRWIARIMVTWAVLSAATMFVNSAMSFYVVRFLLGVAEAGFFPGIILYLTYWFPAARRGRATSLFLTAIAVAGIVGGPASGWILHSLDGANGWRGWQWLFLLEAVPSLVLGVLAWFFLEDRVKNAQWLTPEERELIARDIAAEESGKADGSLASVLGNAKVWLLAFVYFAIVSGLYGVSFWLPSIIKAMGVSDPLQVGFISVVPWAFGIAAMVLVARSADRRREYRWHTAVACVAGAAGLLVSVAFHADVMLSMAGLTICTMGIMCALPIFWSNPTAILGGTAAAMGIAFINSVGNLAGFAIPWIIGLIKDATHSTDAGLHMLAALMVLGAIAVLALGKPAAR